MMFLYTPKGGKAGDQDMVNLDHVWYVNDVDGFARMFFLKMDDKGNHRFRDANVGTIELHALIQAQSKRGTP